MRARHIAFPNDVHALAASRVELKTQFLANRNVSAPSQISELLQGAREVEEMLAGGAIAQGVRNERGNYEVNVAKGTVEPGGEVVDFEHLTKDEPGGPAREVGEGVVIEKSKPS